MERSTAARSGAVIAPQVRAAHRARPGRRVDVDGVASATLAHGSPVYGFTVS